LQLTQGTRDFHRRLKLSPQYHKKSLSIVVEIFKPGNDAKHVIDKKVFAHNSNERESANFYEAAIETIPKTVTEYHSGKAMTINALKGSLMKATRGQANPPLTDKISQELFDS
jgi:aspartyl-tRNA(Asn)/glutamyl-tRNA(Gln) amidotransferase subunit B